MVLITTFSFAKIVEAETSRNAREHATAVNYNSHLSQVTQFCDKDDPETPVHLRHNSDALNEQNIYCNGRSSWEVMREHEDFKNGRYLNITMYHVVHAGRIPLLII